MSNKQPLKWEDYIADVSSVVKYTFRYYLIAPDQHKETEKLNLLFSHLHA